VQNLFHALPYPFVDLSLLAIVGPTGSGKSALALDLAGEFGGEIINCDSLQLYRGFDIATAKTRSAERRGIPHHLVDVLAPSRIYSAGEYARDARDAVAAVSARGRLPVVVGGTGFYLQALLEGLPGLPRRDEALRARLLGREHRRPGSIHRLLSRLEPHAAARIHPHDLHKLVRALEVRILTRTRTPSSDQAEPLRGYRVLKLGLDPERARLHARLDARVRAMFASGLLEEVRQLLARGATGEEKPFESLGYKQALRHLRGGMSLEEAIASTQLETRQYAKRQWTWFRRDARVQWLRGFGEDAAVRPQAFESVQFFLQKNP
jgi:tRNA dimethylallyltransferase